MILLTIIGPVIAGVLALSIPQKRTSVGSWLSVVALALAAYAGWMSFGKEFAFRAPWAGYGLEIAFRNYHFSSFIVLSTCVFGLLVALYSTAFMRDKLSANRFFSFFLIGIGMANGATLADNLVLLLFFWEGLLLVLFGMISVGNPKAVKTATKTFIIVGVGDLCMMAGIALTGHLAGTLTVSQIHLNISGLAGLAFILLVIGAISKAGSMPFHSWIPDAAIDAPLPFMAILPGSLEKLLGIYFLARISLDMFKGQANTWASYLLMTVGALTILLAVMMALIQKDYKKLLSYHAISQVGYMVLGIGTFAPAGIIGGLFHMINNALYKNCLFLTGGSVERQAGSTDLNALGGLGKQMPITFACFTIAALSISGVPPFNGFFSKELVYHGALERGKIFYFAAALGSFFTAASFLKLGHAAFLGQWKGASRHVKEAPLVMLVPMVAIAAICIVFGLGNSVVLNKLIVPCVNGYLLEGHHFGGMPKDMTLVWITLAVLVGALANHIYGYKKTGEAVKAADHIHHAPVLSDIYDKAERRFFDPYDIGMDFVRVFSSAASFLDRAVDWCYEVFSVGTAMSLSDAVRRAHVGNYSVYIVWALMGAGLLLAFVR